MQRRKNWKGRGLCETGCNLRGCHAKTCEGLITIISHNGQKKILLVFGVAYILLFLLFYPKFYYMPDEQEYLRAAYLLREGDVKVSSILYNYGFTQKGSYFVPLYPLGQPLWLVPFTLPGWQWAFLSGMAAMLLGFFVFYRVVKRLGYAPIYALLFLLFPAFVFLSKTLMSEMLSVLLVTTALYFYIGKRKAEWGLAGLVLGLSVLVRVPNAFVFISFLLVSLFRNRQRAKYLFLGFVPPALLVLLHNYILYGSALETGYQLIGLFSAEGTIFKIIGFAVILSIIYPLMFLSQFFYRGKAWREIILTSALFLLFFGFYFANPIKIRVEDLFMGARYVLVIVPLLMVAYAGCLHGLAKKIKNKNRALVLSAAAMVLVLLLAGMAAVHVKYNELVENKYSVFQEIYSRTGEGSLIVTDSDIPLWNYEVQSPFEGMFFCECFGERKSIPLRLAGQYVTEPENTYYMKLWFEGREMKVHIEKWAEYAAKGG